MNLSHYSKNLLFAPFSTSFRGATQSYLFKYVLRCASKICEKIHQKSNLLNSEIGS